MVNFSELFRLCFEWLGIPRHVCSKSGQTLLSSCRLIYVNQEFCQSVNLIGSCLPILTTKEPTRICDWQWTMISMNTSIASATLSIAFCWWALLGLSNQLWVVSHDPNGPRIKCTTQDIQKWCQHCQNYGQDKYYKQHTVSTNNISKTSKLGEAGHWSCQVIPDINRTTIERIVLYTR